MALGDIDLEVRPRDADGGRAEFEAEVIRGLAASRKTLPCRFFYDARGSELFEEITRLPEYYPTVTELGILRRHAHDIARLAGDATVLVEFGSGSSTKTELLLAAMPQLRAYIPIDISASALELAAERLRANFGQLDIRPIVGDFTQALELPPEFREHGKVGFFPGSTIGNFAPDAAVELLAAFRATLGGDARLIVGADLKKDVATLERAYDDAQGVTAAFNLNLLARINRELDGEFDLSRFRHLARYNAEDGRIEMHLVSMGEQTVRVGAHTFDFRAGETIHTENSYKFTVAQFAEMAVASGWSWRNAWTDPRGLFSVHELAAV